MSKSFVPVFAVTIMFKSMHCEKEALQGVTFSLTPLSIKYETLNCFLLVFCSIGNYSHFVTEKGGDLLLISLPVLARPYNRTVEYNED